MTLCNFSPRSSFIGHIHYGSVTGLDSSCCPRTVFRRVAERVVFSLYRKVISIPSAFRPLKECIKVMPLFADSYSFPSVVHIGEVSASTEHVAPTIVNPGSLHPVRSAACANGCPGTFAPTRNAFPISQVSTYDCSLCATRTPAQPQGRTTSRVSFLLDDFPVTKCHASDVDKSWVFHFTTPIAAI